MHFGAQSRGLRAPCERFAPWVTPGPRITRFRLAADLGRMGLVTHRVSNKVSKITSRHLVPLDRAFPAHALVHGSFADREDAARATDGSLLPQRAVECRGECPVAHRFPRRHPRIPVRTKVEWAAVTSATGRGDLVDPGCEAVGPRVVELLVLGFVPQGDGPVLCVIEQGRSGETRRGEIPDRDRLSPC